MVSGIFSIPLEAFGSRTDGTRQQCAPHAQALREYVGSDENRLVLLAAQSLLDRSPRHATPTGKSPADGSLTAADYADTADTGNTVARDDTQRYNPLVLYGPTGTGKSFLALGLAQRWRAAQPQDAVIIISGSDFARSYANAVDTDHLLTFRRKVRAADLFVLDDLHLLGPKPAAQGELVRTMDSLLERDRSLLITSSKAPGLDDTLIPQLQSRLLGGLAVPLTAPGMAARRMLLQRLADHHEVHFTPAAIELLAANPTDRSSAPMTVPELNHAVMQWKFIAATRDRVVDVDDVRQYLREQIRQQQPTVSAIASLVARHFMLSTQDLRGPSRRRHVVRARGIAMSLAWRLTDSSLDTVGRYFGNRDHTTVLHACRQTQKLQENDPAIAQAVEELLSQLAHS